MDAKTISQADYLDILYENRNKKYGGYELRNHYSQRALKSIGLVYGLMSLFILNGLIHKKDAPPPITSFTSRIIELKDIPLPVITIPPPKQADPPPVHATVANTPPVVVADNVVHTPPPTVTDLNNAESGAMTTTGTRSGNTGTIPGTGTVNTPVIEKTDQPIYVPEVMPHFNGDIMEYLQKNIRYPDAARESGIEGRVVVQFVVDENGNISGAKIIRGVAGGCNEEALRVVNHMPRWEPGKQNGRAVKVYYTIPISFLLQ